MQDVLRRRSNIGEVSVEEYCMKDCFQKNIQCARIAKHGDGVFGMWQRWGCRHRRESCVHCDAVKKQNEASNSTEKLESSNWGLSFKRKVDYGLSYTSSARTLGLESNPLDRF